METVLYILWLIIWIPLSLMIVIYFLIEILESVRDEEYSGLWMIFPLLLFIGVSLVAIKSPLGLFVIIGKILGLLFIVGIAYAILQLLREIIKFVIKEFKKMSDEVDVEIKESKEKKDD